MANDRFIELCDKFLSAWNNQNVEEVLACYTPDLVYRDPNTRGEIRGAEPMRRYLIKLFKVWRMHWSRRELYDLKSENGVALLWRASIRKTDGRQTTEVDGMDLVILRDGRIARNDVYFDRSVLMPLLAT